jgi:hypothetical protein
MNIKIIILFVLLILIVGISGCTEKKATNGTWGEKPPATSASLQVINSTTDHYTYNETNYYYVDGYIQNNAESDASNVKIVTTAYDSSGNVFAINDTAYLKPKTVPATGQSEFYAEFEDPDNKIVRYDVKVSITQ